PEGAEADDRRRRVRVFRLRRSSERHRRGTSRDKGGSAAMNPAVSALAQWAEVLVNGALSLDPVAEARIRRLDGVSFRIVSTLPEEELNVRCVGARLLLARGPADKPNVIVTGTSQALLAALTCIGRPDVT